MLIELVLKNFKKHEHLVVNFTEGTNGIYGPNYKGKTTLLYAILFALGGSGQIPGNRLARRGSDGRFSVELTLDIHGKRYRVTRTKSTANLHLYDAGDWTVIASSATAVTDELEKLIGMTVKQWKELHYAKQKNAHSLLRYSANNLHQLMRRLVGAEELDGVQARLKTMATREQGVVDALGQVEGSVEEFQAEIDNTSTQVKVLGQARDAAQGEVRELEGNLAIDRQMLERDNEALIEANDQVAQAEKRQVRLQAARNGVDQARADLDQRTQDHATAKAAVEAFADFDPAGVEEQISQREAVIRRNQQAAQRVDDLREDAREADHRVETADAAWKEAAKRLETVLDGDTQPVVTHRVDQLTTEHAELVANKKTLTSALGSAECPTCKRPMENHDPEKLREELSELETNLLAVATRLQAAKNKAEQVDAARAKLSTSYTALENAKEARARAEGALDSAVNHHKETTAEFLALPELDVPALREKATRFEVVHSNLKAKAHELSRAQNAHQEAEDTLAKLQAFQADVDLEALKQKIDGLTHSLSRVRARVHDQVQSLNDARGRLDDAQRKLNIADGQLVIWHSKLDRVKEQQEKHDKAARRLAKITHLQKYLKANAETYMEQAWMGFMAHASQFANLCTGGDIEGLERTNEGDFVFLEDGEQMQLEEASGAQEAIIGLAVQMALSSAAPCHLNVLLLDEPTADMDPDCSMATMTALGMLGSQVVFVSHHQTDNAICNNAITL